MRGQIFTFPGSQGHDLAGRLDLPDGPVRAWALFAHCFTCTKDVLAAGRIAQGLAEAGIATLRFDFTGLGHSEGDFANTDFSSNIEDLVAAADHLRRAHGAPKLLIGHSLGGAAVLAAAGRIPEAVGVVTIGAPADPAHLGLRFAAVRDEIEAKGEAEVTLAGQTFRIRRAFVQDIEGHRLEAAIAGLRKALIVFHAPRDEEVGIDNAGRIFAAAKHPKSFVSLDGADHLLRRKADALYVARVVAAWASRYLEPEETAAEAEPPEGAVQVENLETGNLAVRIQARRHVFRGDEPASVGGDDGGPTPYEFLSAALGACTAITLRLYARRKGWPLRAVGVSVRHDRIHAADCVDCEKKDAKIDRFRRELRFDGPLDEEQRGRLAEIADHCPVHRTLENEIRIETEVLPKTVAD